MSRSNNVEIISPCKKYFTWSSDDKALKYFDKSKGEKGENVLQSIPFKFLVLDILSSITGYSEKEESGIWSNEVKDIKKDVLTVKIKSGQIAKGLYNDIKGVLENHSAKFASSVYIAYYDENKELVIGNIRFSGASLKAWFDFKKSVRIYEKAISVESFSSDKKGKNEYHIPVFKSHEVSEDTNKKAIELDKELQDYLSKYFNRGDVPSTQSTEIPQENKEEATDDDLPF